MNEQQLRENAINIVQWAINNRYPKNELDHVSDFEFYQKIGNSVIELIEQFAKEYAVGKDNEMRELYERVDDFERRAVKAEIECQKWKDLKKPKLLNDNEVRDLLAKKDEIITVYQTKNIRNFRAFENERQKNVNLRSKIQQLTEEKETYWQRIVELEAELAKWKTVTDNSKP